MEMDLYSPCPCGSGKKVKFCCPRQHVTDYLKVFELIDAEQFAAAADLADRLVAKEPQQICFLALKATFLDPADEDATRQMAEHLSRVAPQHAITHAAQAVVALHDADLPTAIERIQDSIERLENAVPSLLLTGMSMTAGAALQEGKFAASFAHATFVQRLTKGRHSASGELLMRLESDHILPPVVHEDLLPRLEHALGSKLDARLAGLVRRGKWRKAREEAQAFLQRHPESLGALGIMAIVEGNLGYEEPAQEHWLQLADAPELADDLAIDAVLMAESGSRSRSRMLEPVTFLDYRLSDANVALERLLSHRQAVATKQDLSSMGDEETPRPKAMFYLLDGPLPPGDVPLAELPLQLGTVYLYGKQTDREPRLESTAPERVREPLDKLLREVLGDVLVAPETTLGGWTSVLTVNLVPSRYVPEDTPPDQLVRRQREELDKAMQETFPNFPHPLLNGKTPEQSTQEPALRRRLMAALLWLETTSPWDIWHGEWPALWSRFGLTRTLDWPAEPNRQWRHGMTQLVRLDVKQLEDEELAPLLEMASSHELRHAVRMLAQEMTERPWARKETDLNPAFDVLVNLTLEPQAKLQVVERAVAWCRERSLSEGSWLVKQVMLELLTGQTEQAQQRLRHVMTHFRDEPSVMEEVYRLLIGMGVITPDGRLASGVEEAAAAPEAGGGLWTPDQGAPTAAAPQSGSKLWIPGQD